MHMHSRIKKAINEGLNKALMTFDDDIFDKKSKLKNKTAEYLIYQEEVKKKIYTKESYDWLLDQYLTNGFLYIPKDSHELKDIIKICISNVGNECNLNWIDTSGITTMYAMFYGSLFNGDISKWDVSNVKDMKYMFSQSKFNQDISKWDVSNVETMEGLFYGAIFNRDISMWDVSNVTNMANMFRDSKFNLDISKWDVSNVKDMAGMFKVSKFNGNISLWDVSNVETIDNMFDGCPIRDEYKPKFN